MDSVDRQQPKKNKTTGAFFSGLFIGIASTILLAAIVVLVGFVLKIYVFGPSEQEENEIVSNQTDTDSLVDEEMLEKLTAIEEILSVYYYKDDISQEELEEGIYRGVLEAVGDPYTCYYTQEELDKLLEQTSGVYYGIGAYVTLDTVTQYPVITKPIPGSPAEEVGLRTDDVIYEVNGQNTYGMDLDSVVALIKGEEGTTVHLTIARSTESDYIYVDVERRKVEAPTITYEMLEDNMAYIQITEFSDIGVKQFEEALASARTDGMKGLIIDLRANPGGSLTAVVNIARQILPEGLIVYTEDKYGNRNTYSCDGENEFDLPLVVLVDGNSASASEVLAGAIKDYGIGTLVGTTTFGKGIVQQIITILDGSAVKVTTSSYFSPKGNNIHGTGIEPDLVCEFDGEAYYGEEQFDNQLDYAKQVLRDMIK